MKRDKERKKQIIIEREIEVIFVATFKQPTEGCLLQKPDVVLSQHRVKQN